MARRASNSGADVLHLGFTGTRRGFTPEQLETVAAFLLSCRLGFDGAISFHHGLCVGSDAQASQLAHALRLHVVGHPPTNRSLVDPTAYCDERREPRPYDRRNDDIVRESDVILATPYEEREVIRSGTWMTIRHARDAGRTVLLVDPRGRIL